MMCSFALQHGRRNSIRKAIILKAVMPYNPTNVEPKATKKRHLKKKKWFFSKRTRPEANVDVVDSAD